MAGLTSLPRKKNIKGQPHKLAYVTEAEGDLLKSIGGAGKPVKGTRGIPAYYSDPGDAGDMGGPAEGAAESAGGDPEGAMGFSPGGWEGATEEAGETETGGYRGDPRNFGYSMKEAVAAQEQTAAQDYADKVSKAFAGRNFIEPMSLEDDPDYFAPIDEMTSTRKLPKFREYRPDALLQDPVILAAQTNPEFKQMYDDAIKDATRDMSTTDILGTMDQKGNRTGGYINTLEQGGYDKTWGLGIRGEYEVQAPEGMTKAQYDNYVDLYMAFDGTKAGNLRLELDSVAKDAKTTVGDVFGKLETSPTIYGLDPQMNANKVSEYMDSKALDGIIQGVPMAMGIATGNVSPFFLSDVLGINVIEDISSVVKGQLSGTVLDPLIKTTEDVTDIYDKIVPSNMDIADRLREQFNIKGQDFFDKNGFYNQAEPTIDSLVPESMVGPVTDIGGIPSADYFDPIGPPLDLTVGLRSSPSAVPAVSEADRAVERADLPLLLPMADTELARITDMINTNTTVDPVLQRDVSRVPRGSDTLPRLVQQGQPETRQLGRDALGLSTEEEVVRDLTRDVIPDRDVVSSELGTLTASDRAAEIPTTEAISQLSGSKINATTKNYLENYVVDNVKKGLMTNEEANTILAATTADKLEGAVKVFIDRQTAIQNLRELDLEN